MRHFVLTRTSDDGKETVGYLAESLPSGIIQGFCKTLERPWKDNTPGESCIPVGNYVCKYSWSPHLSKLHGSDYFCYQVMEVPDRAGIRIHSLNFYSDSEGCIGLGSGYANLNKDNEEDIINSAATVKKFEEMLNHEDFILTIRPV